MILSKLALAPALALALGLAFSANASQFGRHRGPTATIDIGVLHGTQTSLPAATAPVNKFLGIPYAQTPPKRFAPPEPLRRSHHGRSINVKAWKPACIQEFVYPPQAADFQRAIFNSPAPEESEDCLYVNVYAPSTPAPPGGRAVLFWIYGGGFSFGTASIRDFDGSAFAAYEDVIVVTSNYRTNVFGFPGSPQLPPDKINPGLLDQQFALQWVQHNIAAFGGNKNKVTIFGESAGAGSVDALVLTYPKHGKTPFRAAIQESGVLSDTSSTPASDPYKSWKTLIDKLNCSQTRHAKDPLACARAASAQTIKLIIETQSLAFAPLPDNATFPKSPTAVRKSGKFAKVPVLGGTNAQEGRLFTVGQTDLAAYIQSTFGKTSPQLIPRITAAFPVGNQAGINTPYDRIAQIFTLVNFQCPQASWANASLAAGIPTWRYYYNSSFPNLAFSDDSGVYHSSEIDLVFGTYPGGPVNKQSAKPLGLRRTQLPPTAQEAALSQYMLKAWASFAKNPEAGPGWNGLGTFAGLDLAVLGGADGHAGATLVRQDVVDFQCSLFKK